MSLEEMETTWSNQAAPAPDADARTWIDKTRRSFRTHALLLTIAVLGNALGFGLQIHRLIMLPDRTLANSGWELTVTALTLIACVVGVFLFRRSLRKYRSLLHDTRRCLEMIVREKKQEIVAMTRWVPLAYLGFLGLIVLGKFQSIAAEFETPANAWSGVWMAGLLFFVVSVALFHRANAFLKPEVTELEKTLKSLVAG
jgi:hypothetical protein